MEIVVNILLIAAVAAVAIILSMGLYNMFKGGSGNTSQKLMRARVIMQAVAVILLRAALYFFGTPR